jgi:hypothetical protein
MSIEDHPLTTSEAAALCGITEARLNKYIFCGLTPDVRRGRGCPAAYQFHHILRLWLLVRLVGIGSRLEDAIPVANHSDVLGPLVSDRPVQVFFPGGVPKLSGDPLRDPVLSIPYGDFPSELVNFIAAHIRQEHGEAAAAAALEGFQSALAAARARG